MDIKDINLNAPALPDDEEGTDTSAEGSQPDKTVKEGEDSGNGSSQAENDTEDDTEGESDVEEPRIPYSRFETVNERAIRAEAELAAYKAQRQEQSQADAGGEYKGQLPGYWVELWGDNELSRKAFNAEQQRITVIQEDAARKAVEAIEQRQADRDQHVEKTVEAIEGALTDFQAKTKRTLTDGEQSAVLDIMDELTPKDERGNYQVDPTVFLDKAVELHDLRQLKTTGKTREAKRKAAAIAGASSDSSSAPSEGATHFRPGSWDSWRENPLLPKD